MELKDPIWYPPINVIHHFIKLKNSLSPEKRESKAFRKTEEMYYVAIVLVGLELLQKRKYWLQMVDDREGSPDVRTGSRIPSKKTSADDFAYQDVEVVTYEKHAESSFLDFLKSTKLSPKKSYDSKTLVLCVIKRNVNIPPFEKCRQDIQMMGVYCPVMIVGQLASSDDFYKIAQIYPDVDFELEFNLRKSLNENSHTGVLRLIRGSKAKLKYHPDEKRLPFEKLKF